MFRRRTLEVRVVKQPLGKSTETRIEKEPVVGPDYTETVVTIGLVITGIIVVKGVVDTFHDVAVEIAKK